METESGQEKIERYLDDAIALEAASILALKGMAEDALSSDEALLYRSHGAESETQKQRLEGRLMTLGGTATRSALKDMIQRIGSATTDLLYAARNDGERDTRNLLQAYAMESLEVAVYEALQTAADGIGDRETAALARQIQAEERSMARQLFERIAPSSAGAVLAA